MVINRPSEVATSPILILGFSGVSAAAAERRQAASFACELSHRYLGFKNGTS